MKRTYFGLAAVLLVVVIFVGVNARTLDFEVITVEVIVNILTPLLVVALFLERAQEVFITAWREPRKKELEASADATDRLARYQAETQGLAFVFGFVVSALISIVGIRALEHLVMLPGDLQDSQRIPFKAVDVLLTAAIIAGGSDGIHKMVSVITDFLDMTRTKIQAAAPQTQQPPQAVHGPPVPAVPVVGAVVVQGQQGQGS